MGIGELPKKLRMLPTGKAKGTPSLDLQSLVDSIRQGERANTDVYFAVDFPMLMSNAVRCSEAGPGRPKTWCPKGPRERTFPQLTHPFHN